jgi:hypothetical protein
MKAADAAFAAPQQWCTCEGKTRGKKLLNSQVFNPVLVMVSVLPFCNAQRSCEAGLQ